MTTEEQISLAIAYGKEMDIRREPSQAFFSALGICPGQSNLEKFLCLADAAGTFTNEQVMACGMFTKRLIARRSVHDRLIQGGYLRADGGTIRSFHGGRNKIYSITPEGHRMAESIRTSSCQIDGRRLSAEGRNKDHNIHIQDTLFQLAPYWPDGAVWKTESVQAENVLRPDAVLEMNEITVYVEEDTGRQRASVLADKFKRYRDIYTMPEHATILFTMLETGSGQRGIGKDEQCIRMMADAICRGETREKAIRSAAGILRDEIFRGLDIIAVLNRFGGEVLPYLFPGILFHPEQVLESAGILKVSHVTGGEMLPCGIHPRCSIYGRGGECVHVESVSHSISGALRTLALCRHPVTLMLLFETYAEAVVYLGVADIHAYALLYIYIYAQEDRHGLYFYDGVCLKRIMTD